MGEEKGIYYIKYARTRGRENWKENGGEEEEISSIDKQY